MHAPRRKVGRAHYGIYVVRLLFYLCCFVAFEVGCAHYYIYVVLLSFYLCCAVVFKVGRTRTRSCPTACYGFAVLFLNNIHARAQAQSWPRPLRYLRCNAVIYIYVVCCFLSCLRPLLHLCCIACILSMLFCCFQSWLHTYAKLSDGVLRLRRIIFK